MDGVARCAVVLKLHQITTESEANMAGDARVNACFTNGAEPCGAGPFPQDDAMNESGCSSAPRLAVSPKQLGDAREIEVIAARARGLGHELNNLLTIIKTYTLLVLEDLEPDAPSRADLGEVCGAADRARDLAQQLSVLGREWFSLAPPI